MLVSTLQIRETKKLFGPLFLLLVFSLNFLTKLPISQMFAANGLRRPPFETAYSGTLYSFILSDKMTVTIAPKFLIRFDLFKIFILNTASQMPKKVCRAAAIKMSLSALSRSSEFIAYIDGIYYEGYARQMAIENPARLTYEYYEFLRNL